MTTRPSIFCLFSAICLSLQFTSLFLSASPDVLVEFGGGESGKSVGSAKFEQTSGALPTKKSEGPMSGLQFDGGGQKVVYDSNIALNKPLTVFLRMRLEGGTPGYPRVERSVPLDASGTPFYGVFRVIWNGLDLVMQAGKSFKNEPSGLTVKFSAEETAPFLGQWVLIGFSVKDGEAVGMIGSLENEGVLLKAGAVVGAGQLPGMENVKFALGADLNSESKNPGSFSLGAAAFYRKALTAPEMVGVYEAVQQGGNLGEAIRPASAQTVQALLARNQKDLPQPKKQRIATSEMILEFEDGWLTSWKNLETGEEVSFGKPEIARADLPNRHYLPGPWWVDWKLPADPEATQTKWSIDAKEISPTAVEILSGASRPQGREIHGLQWGVMVPYDQVDAVHFPKGMPPSRLSGKDALGTFVVPSHDLGGRLGELASRGQWRLRFYQIQAKTGGLLIYMDDPAQDHHAALEFRKEPNGLLISNRSIASPPWKNEYTGGKWVVQQYTGYVGAGAQLYQDYLVKAFNLVPLKDRPTAWAQKLGLIFVNAPWTNPLPVSGRRRPEYNYSTNWEQSIRAGEQWLDNLAKVIDPDKVMIYTVDWRAIPNIDRGLQDNFPDPFFVIMCQKARDRGFHVMLHTCPPVLTSDTVTFERYFEHQAKLFGLPHIQGHVFHALNGRWVGGTDHKPSPPGTPTGWTARSGYYRPAIELGMNPAFEGYRYVTAASMVAAVKATGADAIHLDVPNPDVDLNSDKYGMNGLQGWRAFAKLLREMLDEHGLKHVAIGTEVTPPEPMLPYVDIAQITRGKSIAGFVDGISSGRYSLSEEAMIVGQSGEDLENVKKLRLEIEQGKHSKAFDPKYAKLFLEKVRELGEPNINNMVTAPFVQAMPHLGQASNYAGKQGNADDILKNQIVDSLTVWSSLQHDTPPFLGGGWNMFMDVAPYDQLEVIQRYRKDGYGNPERSIRTNGRVLNKFDYGKLALARFWADQHPQIMPPAQWSRSDVAFYSLRDGRKMRVYRSDPQTFRLELSDGAVLAEVDLFSGWKNDALLMKDYEPIWLKNQIDEFFRAGEVTQSVQPSP